ncbi:hypothetical protein JCM14469_26690 [Desulfatiferula olefinivorans]
MAGLQIPGIEPVFENKTTGLDRATQLMSQARSTAGGMQPNIPRPDKTVGQGLTAGLAGAGAGASIGAALTTGAATGAGLGPVGAGVGAAVGLLGYYLS